MRFIPFIDKKRKVDFAAATTLARRLNEDFKVSPAPPQYDIKSLLSALSQGLEEETIVVIGVTNRYYLKLKKALAMVLKAEMFENFDLKKQITELDKEAHELQYQFINGNVVFRSEDGFYSGYGMFVDPHKIIVLPLSEETYVTMLGDVKEFVLDRTPKYNEYEVLEQSRKESGKYEKLFMISALVSVIASLGVALFEVLR